MLKIILAESDVKALIDFYIEKKHQAVQDNDPVRAEAYRLQAFSVARAYEAAEMVDASPG